MAKRYAEADGKDDVSVLSHFMSLPTQQHGWPAGEIRLILSGGREVLGSKVMTAEKPQITSADSFIADEIMLRELAGKLIVKEADNVIVGIRVCGELVKIKFTIRH